jgi:UPF0755 protein
MPKFIVTMWSLGSLVFALFLFLLGAPSSRPNYKTLEIMPGAGFRDIAYKLSDEKIIRSPKTFMLYGILSGAAHQLKPGNYFLSSGSSTPAIIGVLERGPAIDEAITFPEGITLKDMDILLSRVGILSPFGRSLEGKTEGALINFPIKSLASEYVFLKNISNLEGFLFPDTYRFFFSSTPEQVVRKMLDNFEKKAWPLLQACQKSNVKCQMLDVKQILTIASLLEKEAPDYLDRQMIAGVFYRRLNAGIALQVDATLVYVKCAKAFLTCDNPKVYRSDLNIQSSYNTYSHNDLPPGPIGNPGLDSIKAALSPVKSEYLYYLSDPKTKKTIFSKDLEEHIENRAIYLTK